MIARFETYLKKLRETPLAEHTEHTGRPALQALLEAFAAEAPVRETAVQYEPRRTADKGAPDFKVARHGMILGYVEVKAIGADLDRVLKSEQIGKYLQLSDNLLVTDYLHWVWLKGSAVEAREVLATPTDLEGRTVRVRPERAEAVKQLIEKFFSEAPQGIGQSGTLALALAARSRLLRDFIGRELVRQEAEHREGRLYALYEVFREQIFRELSKARFADAFAQMLAYGLFLARLNAGLGETVTLGNVRGYIPGSFPLIRELVRFLEEMREPEYDETRWVVDEVLSIVNGLDLVAIQADLSFHQRKALSRKVRAKDAEEHRLFERDPFIYFYEDYLKAYDPQERIRRGNFYTPPPVVNFIVRAVDDILKQSFGMADGLADHRHVTVLDFACGTGTFLLEVCQQIFETVGGAGSGHADRVVREHIAKNLYGFEYLIAPYTIAHLKLSQYLRDKGHALADDERLQVYLTNTLEPVEPQQNFMLPAITEEVRAAQDVKEKPILVILGNPPYQRFSKNKGAWITSQIEHYKYVDGQHFRERKHWLSDDYVKFIKFAQNKIDQQERGIVGVITNHTYLDNPTFRGMRQSLLRSFNRIAVVNLHGNSRRQERSPDGTKDENVFDIEQGTAIILLIKDGGEAQVTYGDVWGNRLSKYKTLAASDIRQLSTDYLAPRSPMYFLSPHVPADFSSWSQIWSVEDIFGYSSVGMLSARDSLTIGFEKREIQLRAAEFSRQTIEDARQHFRLENDTQDWSIEKAQLDSRGTDLHGNVKAISYRPFDSRWTIYTGTSRGFIGQPAKPLSDCMNVPSNLALATTNRVEVGQFRHALVTCELADGHFVASKETNHVYPLYAYAKDGGPVENLTTEFRVWLAKTFDSQIAPEEVMGYVYSVLYANTYRARYAEFLLVDSPRIPFPEKRDDFETLAGLGWGLVEAHLLRDSLPRSGLARYPGRGDDRVEAVRYAAAEEAVWINATQSFRPVPAAVWEFRIGGYQVLDKYLKSRKGRRLSLDEIGHVARVADALAFTIERMAEIDEVYCAAFPQEVGAEGA